MKKNKILIATLTMLFLSIFCYTKTVEATNFSIYDPRTDQHYQVQVDSDIYYPPELKRKLSEATGLPENLFLFDVPIFYTHQDNYDLELPINQVTKDGVLYNIYHNQEVVVVGLADDNLENVVIASEINQKKVTKIVTYAFRHTGIRSVTFEPNSEIKSIGYECFGCCLSLTNITLPDSLTNIDCCFMGCKSLTNITLPNSLTSIGHECFRDCGALKEIKLPDSLKNIGEECFCYCKALKEITLPNSLTSIRYHAFYGCTSLQKVNLGNNSQLKDIGKGVFTYTKIDEQKFRDRLVAVAIHQFQNTERKRSDQLASMINLTDQKYNNELRDIYSLFNHHCSIDDLIFAYDALTRKVSTERGEDNPDFVKLKQRRACYCESLQRMERERTLDLMKASRME